VYVSPATIVSLQLKPNFLVVDFRNRVEEDLDHLSLVGKIWVLGGLKSEQVPGNYKKWQIWNKVELKRERGLPG
jgi:hypothetical protein